MKNSKILAAFSLTAILIQSTQAQQSIPDEINFKPYYQAYLTAKTVSDKKRAEADKAQNLLIASQRQLQTVIDELNSNAHRADSNQQELNQIGLDQQALDNQNRTNDALIRQDQVKVGQNSQTANYLQDQLRGIEADYNNTAYSRNRADDERRNNARDNEIWENKLRTAETELSRHQKALQDNTEALNKANKDKDAAQDKLVRLTQTRQNQEETITRSQAQIEPAKKQIQELTPKVQQKAAELTAATARQKTAQEAFDRDQKALDALTAQNGPLNESIKKTREQVKSITQVIEQQKALYASTQADLDNAQKNVAVQNQRKTDLTAKQQAATQKRDAAKAESDKTTAERAESQKTLAELNKKLGTYTRGQANDPAVIELRRQIAEVTAKISAQTQQINDANNRVAAANAELTQIAAELPKVNAEIARLNDLIVKGPGTLTAIQTRVAEQETKLAPLSKQLADLEAQLAAISPQTQAAQAQLQTSRAALDAAKSQTASVQTEHRTLSTQLTTAQNQLKQAQDALTQNQAALEKTKAEITSVMKSIDTLNQQIADLQKKNGPLEGAVRVADTARKGVLKDTESSRERLKRATDRVNDLNRALNQISDRKRKTEQDLRALNNETIDLQRGIQSMQAQIDANVRQIASNRTRINSLNDDNTTMEARNRVLAQSQNNFQAQVNSDQDQFTKLDQLALSAETATESKNHEYLKRKNRYDFLLAEAQKAGAAAGEAQGQIDGEKQGHDAGVELGTKEGTDRGKAEGLLAGYNSGKSDGDKEGLNKGRATGEASTEDYERGVKAGIELGKADAQAEATRVDLPKGKADQFVKLTAMLPAQNVQIDQETKAIRAGAPSGGTAFSGAMSSGARMKVSLALWEKSGACDQQSYVDFKNACAASYKVSYEQSKATAYEDAKERVRPDAAEAARVKAFDANKLVRYKEGYDLMYGDAFQRGLKEGKATAEKRGIADGRTTGYQANRVTLGQKAYDQGLLEMTQHFASQPVTLVKSARLTRVGLDGSVGGAIGASDLLKLELKVANHGAKDSGTPPVKVEMKALTKGLIVRQTSVPLASVPANTTALVSNVLTAQVLESATSGSQEQVQIRYTDELGNSQDSILKVDVQPNLQVSFYNVDYDGTPKVNKAQKVTVTVSNDGDLNPTEKVTLGLSTSAAKTAVRLDEPELEVSRLTSGKRIKVKGLAYTVTDDAALRAGITMTVYVKHGARVVAKQDFQIRK